MARDKYLPTQEEREASVALWASRQRPLTNEEMKEWVMSNYAFVRGISRTKYSATIVVVGIDGEHEIEVSLPTANK